jgi:prepilin-type N-terminal cleavage/methylation domain-containing protein
MSACGHSSPAATSPPAPRAHLRAAFTLIEVMISVAVLSVALATMLGTIFSLHNAHQGERDEAQVQQICNTMVERVMGANFSTLGQMVSASIQQDQNAWSWQRRATLIPSVWQIEFGQVTSLGATLTQPMNPPLMENVPTSDPNYATRDLMALGLETQLTGLNGLRIYLEYYNVNLFSDLANLAALPSPPSPHAAWVCEVGDPTLTDPTTNTIPAAANPVTFPTFKLSTNTPTDVFHPEFSGGTWNGGAANPTQINLVQPVPTDLFTLVQRVNDAVLVRILVFWIASNGGQRWHEVTIMRRNNI